VKISHQHPLRHHGWYKKSVATTPYKTWLIDSGSLTQRLQTKSLHFSVKSLKNAWGKPLRDESASLVLRRGQVALIREVLLCDGDVPLVYAHSVLPRNSLRAAWWGLGRLGNKPLGAALFANQHVKRMPIESKKMTVHHPLFRQAVMHLSEQPVYLWARRSVFMLRHQRILVTEVFLPEVLKQCRK
jgi:chorismate--pyruvate lyase